MHSFQIKLTRTIIAISVHRSNIACSIIACSIVLRSSDVMVHDHLRCRNNRLIMVVLLNHLGPRLPTRCCCTSGSTLAFAAPGPDTEALLAQDDVCFEVD